MKFELPTSRRKAVSAVAIALSAALVGYGLIAPLTHVAAQQQTPVGAPKTQGGSSRPTGGQASGPGEGAQAVAADPGHGQAAPTPPAPRGGFVAYPDRPKAPQAVLDRGKGAFSVNCAFCHGSDAGGGSVGPNLLRSEVVLQDKNGELILPIVHGARAAQGMPKIEIADSTVPDIAAWLHSLKTGGNMRSTEKINIVVGNADAGKATYTRMCASCHSTDADLKGFAAKFPDARAMQQAWILPGVVARGPAAAGAPVQLHVPPVTATVTEANGSKLTGRLGSIDDFYVEITTEDGVMHRYIRSNDVPKVDIHDPLAPHRAMLRTYNDKDIHDITAYLESLK
jgi:cytochrome c oxidase cbb3-type subunit 3